MKYRGQFTMRDRGTDIPVSLEIYTEAGRSETAKPLVFAGEPAVVTWESGGLTDVIHRSQLRVRLIALNDGDYRDIASSGEQVYGLLYYAGEEEWKTLWCGAYSDTTWLEPFSRERGYELELTFSDFGFLERLDYSGFESEEGLGVRISDMIEDMSRIITGRTTGGGLTLPVMWKPMNGMTLTDASNLEVEYKDLIVRSNVFMDGDEPRNLLEILTDVLEPLNIHIMQYAGSLVLFRPDSASAASASDLPSASLLAEGTDAELESVERYRRIVLDYDPTDASSWEVTPNKQGFTPTGSAETEDGGVLVASDDSNDSCRGSHFDSEGRNAVQMQLLWLSSDNTLAWKGVTPSAPATGTSPSAITWKSAPLLIDIGTPQMIAGAPKHPLIMARLELWAAFRRGSGISLQSARVSASVTFTAVDGTVRKLSPGTTGANIWEEGDYTGNDPVFSGASFGEGNVGTLSLSMRIPVPSLALGAHPIEPIGRISIEPDFSSATFNDGDGSGSTWAAIPIAIGFVSLSAEPEMCIDGSVMDFVERVEMTSRDGASEEFSKSFRLGTMNESSIDSVNGLVHIHDDEDEGRRIRTQSFMDDSVCVSRYADFLLDNYSEASGTRWRLRGTYSYTHLEGLPVFFAALSTPLRTLEDPQKAFFPVSEEWRLRSGLSQLTIEEVRLETSVSRFNFLMPRQLNPPVQFVANEKIDISNDTFSFGAASVTMRSAYILGSSQFSAAAYINAKGAIDVVSETYITEIRLLRTRGVTASELSCDSGQIGDNMSWTGKAKSVRILTRVAFSVGIIDVITMTE